MTGNIDKKPVNQLFSLGLIVATPGALNALDVAAADAEVLLLRHQSGDWGRVPPEDAEQNQFALSAGNRILSSYELTNGQIVWVITEADRSVTTLLLPEEY